MSREAPVQAPGVPKIGMEGPKISLGRPQNRPRKTLNYAPKGPKIHPGLKIGTGRPQNGPKGQIRPWETSEKKPPGGPKRLAAPNQAPTDTKLGRSQFRPNQATQNKFFQIKPRKAQIKPRDPELCPTKTQIKPRKIPN